MKTMTIKEFALANDIKTYALTVRANMNGYLFVTFISATNEATNVYFSKSMTEKITAGDDVKVLFKEHACQIAETTNADGETRLKLIGNSERGNIEDLF